MSAKSETSAPVDVLAVLDAAIRTRKGKFGTFPVCDLHAARAAVAELVATVGVAVTESRLLPEEKQAEWLRGQCRAALAKFGGA